MPIRRWALLGAAGLLVVLVLAGVALAAKTYPDRIGDARLSPDLDAVTLSNTKTKVTFRVSFTKAPPLGVSRGEGWIEMLLIGIDVPPLSRPPLVPGGDWASDFALGTHGPSKTGVLVRLPKRTGEELRRVARFGIVTRGSTLTFSVPRRALGDPAWFAFTVAAAREWSDEAAEPAGARADFAPAHGTFRYRLTG